MWEDEMNKSGGKWIIQVPRKRDGKDGKQILDEMWLNSIMGK